MLLVSERQVSDPPASPAASPESPPTPTRSLPPDLHQELLSRAAWRQGVIGGLNVAVQILAARLILLLATCGAFALSWLAIQSAQPLQLGAVGLYLAGVILPLVWLAGRR